MRIYKFLVLIFILLLCQVGSMALAQDIEIDKHKYYDTLTIKTKEYIRPRVSLLKKPTRLVIDLRGEKINSSSLKSKRIKKIFTKPGKVVVYLNRLVDYENASIFGKNQVVIEIRDRSRPSIYTAAKMPSGSPPKALPKIRTKKITPQIVEVVTKRPIKGVLKGKVIVVDPGHGGKDPGAIGLYGLVEKDLTLRTAYKLVDFLKKSGAKVYLTRKRNVKVDLKEVAAFANRIKADAYVGIHYNATYNRKINGTETYYYTNRSRKLAEFLHNRIRKKTNRPDRRVRKARLYTISHAVMPAVIVEPVFMTNPTEARMLKSDQFLKGIAWGITSGLKEYFKWRK